MKKNPQAPSPIVDASTHAPEGARKLVRQGPRPMALEQRFKLAGIQVRVCACVCVCGYQGEVGAG